MAVLPVACTSCVAGVPSEEDVAGRIVPGPEVPLEDPVPAVVERWLVH